ncbi:MAG: hypothetical protein H0X28_13600 [Solirubrobacterales bacterium]|nr:hypothetical protein [Solirubrobacterales bacterium]
MADDDTISSERLDRRDSLGAEKSPKPVQGALPFEHQPHNGALGRRLGSPHRLRT